MLLWWASAGISRLAAAGQHAPPEPAAAHGELVQDRKPHHVWLQRQVGAAITRLIRHR
jgi:hypothetical protein